jgi:hypothetical protein
MSLPLPCRMAVEFAVQCRAKHLVLFHLSPRYRPIKVRTFVLQVVSRKCEIEIGKIGVLGRQRFDADLVWIRLKILMPILLRLRIYPKLGLVNN